jgi:hypothetical protein
MVLIDTFREVVQPVDECLLTVHGEKAEKLGKGFCRREGITAELMTNKLSHKLTCGMIATGFHGRVRHLSESHNPSRKCRSYDLGR